MRNYPNFLEAYCQYAGDQFCPPQFHLWTGLSIIAGALERKVWVKPTAKSLFPNLYVLLVSHPQVGKSTALDRGTDLLEHLRAEYNHDFKMIPEQATEAALIELMNILSSYQVPQATNNTMFSSGFFYASEASSSALKNEHGDFNATLTRFYDCPTVFRKKLKGDKHTTEIPHVCFNVLAGTTFDFLKRLVNEESVMGGLASRFIYVTCRDRFVRTPKWGYTRGTDLAMRGKLLADLVEIHKMVGEFKPTPEFIALWESAHPEHDKYLIGLDSTRVESLKARKLTNLTKVCMLLSASEGDSYVLTADHWHKAEKLMEEVMADNTLILSSAIIGKTDTQAGLNQLILQTLRKSGGNMRLSDLRKVIIKQGNDFAKLMPTLEFMGSAGQVKLDFNGGGNVKLLADPDAGL